MTAIEELVRRLDDDRPRVRRLATADLARIDTEPDRSRALDALTARLERGEPDERVASAIIEALGRARHRPAKDVLWRLYEDPSTPVAPALGAVLAHDRIELAGAVDSGRGSDDGA